MPGSFLSQPSFSYISRTGDEMHNSLCSVRQGGDTGLSVLGGVKTFFCSPNYFSLRNSLLIQPEETF